jgi:hypothetical protein
VEEKRHSTQAVEPPPLRSHLRRRLWIAALAGLILLMGAGVGWWVTHSDEPAPPPPVEEEPQ